MIDIHAHILPGYDDGARSVSDALIMAEMAVDDGVSAIVATPHVLDDRLPGIEKLFAAVEEMQFSCSSGNIAISILPGMEIMATEKTGKLLAEGKLITLNGSRYPLLEFGFNQSAAYMERILYSVQSMGFSPILAHPERYIAFQKEPGKIVRLAEKGIILQLDKDSIFGRMEKGTEECAAFLLEERCAHAVASDAHRPHYRTTRLSRAQEHVALRYSYEYAQLLFVENPRAILQDIPVGRF